MSEPRRPWWLFVSTSAGLETTIQEQTGPGEHTFTIRGEPAVRGLAWLIWGPLAALLAVFILTLLAVGLGVREQPAWVKVVFVGLFLVGPALAWAGATLVAIQVSKTPLAAIRQARSQTCTIRLNQREGVLSYKVTPAPAETHIAFADIQQAKVTHPIGERDGKKTHLVLHTDEGTLILMDETLGTTTQKIDLAQKIQEALVAHSPE